MAANNILPFSQDPSALVESQATYLASSVRPIGNQNGIADPQLVNKALLQASAMAVGLAQFLADNQTSDINDSLVGSALSTIIANAIKNLVAVPAGMIVWVPQNFALPGTLKLNGALISRTTYARLYAMAVASGNIASSDGVWSASALYGQFSPGDGSTTFRLPDARGMVFRAWDDSRGLDSGRGIGTYQVDQLLAHTHGLSDPGHGHSNTVSDLGHGHTITLSDPGHGHGISDPGHAHSISDPGHLHPNATVYSNESGSTNPWGSGGFGSEGTFDWNTGSSSTGIGIYGAGTGISVSGAGCGITASASSNGSNIFVSVNSNTCGITVGNSSGGSEVRTKTIALLPCIYF